MTRRPARSRRRRLSFPTRFALLLALLGALVAGAAAVIPLTQAVDESRVAALDRASDKAAVAANLLRSREASLDAFCVQAVAQFGPAIGAALASAPTGESTPLAAIASTTSASLGADDVVAIAWPGGTVNARGRQAVPPSDPTIASLVGWSLGSASLVADPAGMPWLRARCPVAGSDGARVVVLSPLRSTDLRALGTDLATGTDPATVLLARAGVAVVDGRLGGVDLHDGQPVDAAVERLGAGGRDIVPVAGSDAAVAATSLDAGYTLVVSTPVRPVSRVIGGIATPLIVTAAALIGLTLIVVYIVVQHDLQGPLRRLDRAVAAMTRSDFSSPVPIGTDDEIGRLGASFDVMRRHLRATIVSAETRAAIALDLTAVQPLTEALVQVCRRLRDTTGARVAYVVVQTGDELGEAPHAVWDGDCRALRAVALLDGPGPAAMALRLGAGAPLIAQAPPGSEEARAGLREVCAAPLQIGLRACGVVALADRPGGFGPEDQALLSACAEQTALAVERDAVLAATRRQASTDSLTGLPNRRQLEDALERQTAGAERSGLPHAVLMLDIDHFKALNDTHGHAEGDRALRRLARVLLTTVRRSDLAARYGGEEFVVVLSNTDREQARHVAEKIRTAVQETDMHVAGMREPLHLTVSIGGVAVPEDGFDAAVLLERADSAMYRAKGAGRNRVRFFGDPPDAGAPAAAAIAPAVGP